jgi:hypothetical protein
MPRTCCGAAASKSIKPSRNESPDAQPRTSSNATLIASVIVGGAIAVAA